MFKLFSAAIIAASSVVSAYPLYGYYYPGQGDYSRSFYHNSGAYDNGATTSVSPYGSTYNSWDNGFSASQNSYATPYGAAENSSYRQWSNNAYSRNYYGFPRFW
ncbi:hypothetical protein FB645_002163 [Coemansia sp. IMI 203386]|nr:hypothetical protein FB645_002163 [Coemansia sp. IMI 203386]